MLSLLNSTPPPAHIVLSSLKTLMLLQRKSMSINHLDTKSLPSISKRIERLPLNLRSSAQELPKPFLVSLKLQRTVVQLLLAPLLKFHHHRSSFMIQLKSVHLNFYRQFLPDIQFTTWSKANNWKSYSDSKLNQPTVDNTPSSKFHNGFTRRQTQFWSTYSTQILTTS